MAQSRLLFKLACCGVSPDALSWFESYLLDRAITARVEGIYLKSSGHSISTGVPQGSHLGPILFAVFINDLTSAVQKSQTELYVDDALIHKDTSKRHHSARNAQSPDKHVGCICLGQNLERPFLPSRTLFFRLAILPQTHVSNSLCLFMRKISTS